MKALPPRLYKYRSLATAEERERVAFLLTHRAVYFAYYEDLNDPHDCRIPFRANHLGVEEMRAWAKLPGTQQALGLDDAQFAEFQMLMLSPRTEIEPTSSEVELLEGVIANKLRATLNHMGILSLSASNAEPKLWAHYADNHRGMCVEFTTENNQFFGNALPVTYESAMPRFEHFRDWTVEGIHRWLTTKSHDWEHEDEWRAFHPRHTFQPAGVVCAPPNTLTGIIFGHLMSRENRNIAAHLIGAQPNEVRIYESRPNRTGFGLDIVHIGTKLSVL